MIWSRIATSVAWPLARRAAGEITKFLAENPQVQTQIQGQLTRVQSRIADAQKARTPEAKVTRAMSAVREQAQAVLDHEHTPADADRAHDWVARSHKVDQALPLLPHLARRERKARLAQIEAHADALVAEALLSLVGPAALVATVTTPGPALPPSDEPVRSEPADSPPDSPADDPVDET